MAEPQNTNDPEWEPLLRIESWLNENGWDKLGTPEFDVWLESEGIDKADLTIHCCQMPEGL